MEGNVFFLLPFKVTPNYCTQSTRVWKKTEKQSTWISLIWKNHDACFPWFPISVWPDQQKWNQIWDGHWAMLIPKTDQIWMAMDQQLLIIPYFWGTRGRAFINPSYFGVRSTSLYSWNSWHIPGGVTPIRCEAHLWPNSPFYVEKTLKNMVDPRFLQPKHQFLIIVVAQLLLENQTRFPPCRCSTARRNREESERADHQSRVTLAQLAAELTIEKPSYL